MVRWKGALNFASKCKCRKPVSTFLRWDGLYSSLLHDQNCDREKFKPQVLFPVLSEHFGRSTATTPVPVDPSLTLSLKAAQT